MSQTASNPTPRRSFLGGIAASAGALLVGRWSTAHAEAAPPAAADEWVSKIKGTYRQVFDITGPGNTTAIFFALNFVNGVKEATKAPDSEITAVVVFRYLATAMTLNDAVWAKYKLGEVLGVTDPATKAPTIRNLGSADAAARTGQTYEQLASKPTTIFVACNHAITVISGMAAAKIGVTPEEAKKDFLAGLIPGVHLSAAGVYAVNRAQQAGCTYCGTALV
jgi:hypothetical protein